MSLEVIIAYCSWYLNFLTSAKSIECLILNNNYTWANLCTFLVTFEIAACFGGQYFWAALIWLRIGSIDWPLWMREMQLRFQTFRRISWLTEELISSEERPCSFGNINFPRRTLLREIFFFSPCQIQWWRNRQWNCQVAHVGTLLWYRGNI